ncbi:MAG TPA: Hpt domain-containing protein [Leptospiraceae bacterium]|nr:Hpt domain-containing protein [Leptospiraceae bacterium]HMW08389.1 Hpt domain-containing protein [Leptospiraceae bacterium]HMX33671.1 Hpt domain-containing protein [Leptospiraceae bacterium]HMY34114.1 Hpt domain-containing protein [Leptospiraceae bacterium]HMZ65979.1 Hpt domain-containing protein [Leptospiraceae bacterium]
MNIDWSRIEELISPEDPDDVLWLKGYLNDLIVAYDGYFTELNEGLNKRDQKNVISILHQMKGVAANNGLETVFSLIKDNEQYSKENNLDKVFSQRAILKENWDLTKKEIQKKFNL